MTISLTLTERATRYIQTMLNKQPGSIFRLSIKKTGCTGYTYAPSINETMITTDVLYQSSPPIYLDVAWLHLLDGITVDYIEEEKNGLKQKRLVFNNNKEKGRCGCGESFHV